MAIGVLGGYLCRLIEFVLLAVSITLSVTTALLVIGVKSDFKGNCPLFPTVPDWNFFAIFFNDVSNCNYIIGISGVGAIVAAIAGIYVLIECIRGKHIFWAVPFVQMIVYALFGMMIGGAAAILTAGFKDLCNDLLMGEFRTHDKCFHGPDASFGSFWLSPSALRRNSARLSDALKTM
ncbi:uncharacterized protein [Diadema antillarum]|uniref:uncharacterized protein n=1 Tax=Diadema antillarum TaxID=105358 RepID=UPI003A8790E3